MITHLTVVDLWRPSEKSQARLYDILLIFGGSIFIALSAQLAIGWPIPFTMQTFAVLMIGALFGSRRATLTVALYLLEGLAGLPVFSYGRGGYAIFLGQTGGYLAGFLAAAFVTGLLAQRGWDKRIFTTVMAMIIGNVIIYSFGLFWYSHLAGFRVAFVDGLLKFIPGDLIKIVLAAALLPNGWKLLKYFGFAESKKYKNKYYV